MQQTTRRLALVVGGTFFVAAGMVAMACSTDNGTSSSGALPTIDSGKDSNKPSSSGGGDDDDSATDGGGPTPDCSAKEVPFLPDNSKGTFYCPFTEAGVGCTDDQICCNPGIPDGSTGGFPPSFCTADPTKGGASDTREATCAAAAGGAANWQVDNFFNSMWECGDKNNCPTNTVCCATSNPLDAGASDKVNVGKNQDTQDIPAACNALQLFKTRGTKCATSCSTTEIQMCSTSDNNCAAGFTCTPLAGSATKTSSIRFLGYCRANSP